MKRLSSKELVRVIYNGSRLAIAMFKGIPMLTDSQKGELFAFERVVETIETNSKDPSIAKGLKRRKP